MNEDSNPVLYSVDGPIANITLNRPKKRNALNNTMISGVKEALLAAGNDSAVRVVIITGAGTDFCSGADLAALQQISKSSIDENLEDAQSLMNLYMLIRQVKVPVIAAVRGRALAGGCGLATACDIVLASESSSFGYPEVKIGFVPAMVMAILRRNVSEKRAFELITCGGEIGSTEAERIGLVNHVFNDDVFDSEVRAFAERFEKVSQSAVSLSKRLLYQMDGMNFDDALRAGVDVNTIARMTDDCQQGIGRFLKK
jgi:methylglutaconyl-CoA hydratase